MKGLRAFYNDYESTLVPKTRETRDLEAEENRAFDLHRKALDALRTEHATHVAVIEAEFGEALAESKREYQSLVQDVEGQGFRVGAPGICSLGAHATPETFEHLKEFLARRMPEETQELINQGLAGAVLPASYGGGSAVDRAVSLWAGVISPFMTPADAVVSAKGREVLTAIIAAVPSGLALHEAYEHHLDVWR